MLFIVLIVCCFGGWYVVLLVLLFLFLLFCFLGYLLINLKDIFFVCGYMMFIYFVICWFDEILKVSIVIFVGLVGGIVIVVGICVGGLLVVVFFGLFGIIFFLLWFKEMDSKERLLFLGKYVLYGFILIVVGLVLVLLFWFFVLVDLVVYILEVLVVFSNLKVEIWVLFGGENVMLSDVLFFYFFSWFWCIILFFLVIGIIGVLLVGLFIWWCYCDYWLFLLLLVGIFLGIYVVLKDSILYDGWCYLIFVYFFLVVLVSLFWSYVFEWMILKG